VGFDIVFQGQEVINSGDIEFSQALRNFNGGVVLALAWDQETDELLLPVEQFKEHTTLGLINAPPDRDGVVRRLRAYIKLEDFSAFSFAVQVAALFDETFPQLKGNSIILGNKRLPLNFNGTFNINYLLKPKDFEVISFSDLIEENFEKDLFKGKIVLIGPTAEIMHDVVSTPLGRMSGVFVHANGITTILNQRYLRFLPLSVRLLFFFAVLGVLVSILLFLSPLRGLLLSLGTIILVLWLSVFLKFQGFKLPLGAIAVSAFGFLIMGNVYNYFKFLTVIMKIKNRMIIDPFTNLFKLRYFYDRTSLEIRRLSHRRHYLLVILFPEFEAAVKEIDFGELKNIWKGITSSLFDMSLLWARYSGDTVVGLRTGKVNPKALQEGLKAILFESKIKVNVKIGYVEVNPSVNIRDASAYLIEALPKDAGNIVNFNKESLPHHIQRKLKGADFLSTLDADAEDKNKELLSILEKLAKEERRTNQAYLQLIASLVNALEAKDPYTEGHSERVANYAVCLAEELGLSLEEKEKIKKAGFLHDLGKIGIPDEILHKKGKLTEAEFSRITEHEILGIKILEPIKDFQEILPYILHHHESFDGTGYPHGLAGNFIPLGARIMAVADIFDALSTGRDYKDAYSLEESSKMLKEIKGSKLDPELVDTFLQALKKRKT
jgi:putative nucleotidyltransferase with HDIG domain